MLRVSVEVVPGGDTDRGHELAALAIARVADVPDGRSSYAAFIERASGPPLGGQVPHLPRHGPLELVRRVLDVACIDAVAELPTDVRSHLARLAALRQWP